MASVTISLRTDSDLKKQAEEILNQLGLTLNGTINMLLHQIVREQSVPLSMSISSQNSLYSELLLAEEKKKNGFTGIRADKILEEMDKIIAEAVFKHEV